MPRTGASGRGRCAPAAKVLKRVKFSTRGNKAAGSRKPQNRGSRNSTGDVL
ncbi:single-stranded DNA-binding protein [Escherichia coli]|nr:single-stranded DNA-binding protein [Salmonella enterica subsp. enterica serovar Reading]EEC1011136.1 single-stranded DNA-binding protein [Salmonella enterica subsp. enterica]EFA4911379.1 single-stranded DNA-binding protein [Escherichia coli]EFD5152296.1 single-stranded DNA-binding protein [Escherichia coli]EFO3599140.1 single-stranded DNA-binding protein [Escherichia coli]